MEWGFLNGQKAVDFWASEKYLNLVKQQHQQQYSVMNVHVETFYTESLDTFYHVADRRATYVSSQEISCTCQCEQTLPKFNLA